MDHRSFLELRIRIRNCEISSLKVPFFSRLPPGMDHRSFLELRIRIRNSEITSLAVLDPDPYWECGSGSRSMEIDQNLHKKNLVSCLSKRLLYLRCYVFLTYYLLLPESKL
jgi:hypothetical protein